MKRWNLAEMIGKPDAVTDEPVIGDSFTDDPAKARSTPRVQSYIDESFAYAEYCASNQGAERINFEEFLRRWPRD